MHELLKQAQDLDEKKGKEHNTGGITYASYCPFGALSSATLLHREALRVCACAEHGDIDGQLEHLRDVVVFAMKHYDYLVEHRPGVACPYHAKCNHACRVTGAPVDAMWWSMCDGTGTIKFDTCRSYQNAELR